MPVFPIQSTTGDPIFRSQNSSLEAIRHFSRSAADSTQKLNSQERIVNAGDDALTFSTSRRARADLNSLKVVQETGQINVSALNLASGGLEAIKGQLDTIKRLVTQAQVADPNDTPAIQAEIDLALAQIDSTAKNTKLGGRSLLDGSAGITALNSIMANGTERDFAIRQSGQSITQSAGVQDVKVNKIGTGGPTRTLTNGATVLSLRACIISGATKAAVSLVINTAGNTATYRVTGKLGSAVISVVSTTPITLTGQAGQAAALNALAEQTGVVLTGNVAAGTVARLETVGYGDDEFIKIEKISGSGAGGVAGLLGTAANGAQLTLFGKAGTVRINGQSVNLGGEFGTSARYLANGNDIEVKFSTVNIVGTAAASLAGTTSSVVMNVDQGIVGLLGIAGTGSDVVTYGIGKFTTDTLGRGNGIAKLTSNSGAAITVAGVGNGTIATNSIADLSASGSLALSSGQTTTSLRTVDRAIAQVIAEQARLGTLEGNFTDAIARAENSIGSISAADADLIGVDAATEISNLVASQLGVSTATSLMSQSNQIKANLFSLLRG
jgi:flagellin-like hook-associated protein FlgL